MATDKRFPTIILDRSQKLGFLSAIQHKSTSTGTTAARCDIDSFMVSLILKFTTDDDRRKILWIK